MNHARYIAPPHVIERRRQTIDSAIFLILARAFPVEENLVRDVWHAQAVWYCVETYTGDGAVRKVKVYG